MSNLPKHNPVLRAIYCAIALVMLVFFTWLFADPNALYYVGPSEFQADDYASCVQAGGELHGSRCYMSETVSFEGDYASCVRAGGELHGSRCYMSETIFFER